jgi:hypothetical protein
MRFQGCSANRRSVGDPNKGGNLYLAGKSYRKREFPRQGGQGVVLLEVSPSTTGNSYKKKQQEENRDVFAILFPQQGIA